MINGGLFEQAERAKIETTKGQYHDRLYATTMSRYTEKRGQGEIVSRQEIKEMLEEERENDREEWIADGNNGIREISPDDGKTIIVTSREGYIFHVIVHEDDRIDIVDKGEGEPPKEIPTLDEDLETGNIKFIYTPSEWTNGNIVATINTEVTGYTLEYSKTGTASDWENYISGVEYTQNGTIYARLSDGTNVSNVATGNVTNIDKIQPNTFGISPTTTTNSITCPVVIVTDAEETSTNGSSGIKTIEYKLDSGAYGTSIRTWNGLTQGSNHTVYVRIEDNAGNTREVSKSVTVGSIPNLDTNLQTGNITFSYSPSGWTNGNVDVIIETTIEGYTLEYSKTGTASDWENYISGVEYTQNRTIYARLSDGTNVSNVASGNITNIDKLQPNTFTISPTTTTNSITCPVVIVTDAEETGTDGSSGIKTIEYKLDNGAYSENTRTWNGLTQGTNHTVYVKVADNAGNTREISKVVTVGSIPNLDTNLQTGNIRFTYTPGTWTNGNVIAKISTEVTGYTLQYSINGSDWTNCTLTTYANGIQYTQNGTIYARLTDGVNISNVATGNITIIDKLLPNTFSITAVSTINSITVSGSTTDAAKTTTNGMSGIKRYEYKIGNGAYQTSNILTGLSAGTTYTVYMKAIDNAGNERVVSSNITTSKEYIEISTRAQLEQVGSSWVENKVSGNNTQKYIYTNSAKYKLMNNINLNNVAFEPLPEFQGEFSGNSKTISNLTIEENGVAYAGLFTKLSGNSYTYNLTLTNVYVHGGPCPGALAGGMFGGRVSNVTSSGTVAATDPDYRGYGAGRTHWLCSRNADFFDCD